MEQQTCPITLEKIRVPGYTETGSVYEYTAILRWLETHDTDPATGLPLKCKYVYQGKPETYVYDKYMIRAITLKAHRDAWQKRHNSYVHMLLTRPLTPMRLSSRDPCQDYLNAGSRDDDEIPKTLDLTFMHFEDEIIRDQYFKGYFFDGSRFSCCTFIRCYINHCSFIACAFKGVRFVECTFTGGGYTMFKSTGFITFMRCRSEGFSTWTTLADNNGFTMDLLYHRGYEGSFHFD